MRGLKTLVIILGIVLLGGTVTLVGAILWRGNHPIVSSGVPVRPPGAAGGAYAGGPYESTLDLPAGAEIASIQPSGERLVLQIALPDGRRQLVILDLRSGARLGTIELRAGP